MKPDAPVECFGPEASARTAQFTARGRAGSAGDRRPTPARRTTSGRVLAYVTPEGARFTVNEALLREGFATLFVFDRSPPFTRATAFRRAQDAARDAGLGLWGSCPRPGR